MKRVLLEDNTKWNRHDSIGSGGFELYDTSNSNHRKLNVASDSKTTLVCGASVAFESKQLWNLSTNQ